MSEAREAVRRWLQGREALGEPALFVRQGERGDVIERLRTAGRDGNEAEANVVGRLAREGSREEILALPDLATLREVAEGCTRCSLHTTRTTVVFADGSPKARLLCVGEAPGANEDRTGLPFVGRAGKLLDRLLLSAGFPRSEVFICNVLKCRPPGNRNPLPDEIEACSPFMLRQVELVNPTVIVAFGTFAAQTLLGVRDSLRHLRGRTHLYQGYPLVVTYHPAALLRNPGWTRPSWRDLQLARRIADGDHRPAPSHPRAEPDSHEDAGRQAEMESQLTLGGRDG
jgi:uracil-DNA glycosylase family 4